MKFLILVLLIKVLFLSNSAFSFEGRAETITAWSYVCSSSETPPIQGWLPSLTNEVRSSCSESHHTMWLKAVANLSNIEGSKYLFVEQSFMDLQVWINNSLIYSYEGKLLPSRHHFIQLPTFKAENEIYFRSKSWANALGLRGEVRIGAGNELFIQFFTSNIAQFTLAIILFLIGFFSVILWIFKFGEKPFALFGGFSLSLSFFLLKFSELNFLIVDAPQFWMWTNFAGVCFTGPFFISFHLYINTLKSKYVLFSKTLVWVFFTSIFIYGCIFQKNFGTLFLIEAALLFIFIFPVLTSQIIGLFQGGPKEKYLNSAYLFLASIIFLAVLDELKILSVNFIWFSLASSAATISFAFALVTRYKKTFTDALEQKANIEVLNGQLKLAFSKRFCRIWNMRREDRELPLTVLAV